MYFPASQFTPNLYTNGDEYVLSTTGEPYRGYYFKTYQNKLYTGKTPNDTPTIELISSTEIISSDPLRSTMANTDQILPIVDPVFVLSNTRQRYLPQSIVSLPTSSDYGVGYCTRYFCKKTNELKYMETDNATYNKLLSQDVSIAWDLYIPVFINWHIVGDEKKVYLINKTSVQIIERDNQWYGFTSWFKDNFAKYLAL